MLWGNFSVGYINYLCLGSYQDDSVGEMRVLSDSTILGARGFSFLSYDGRGKPATTGSLSLKGPFGTKGMAALLFVY